VLDRHDNDVDDEYDDDDDVETDDNIDDDDTNVNYSLYVDGPISSQRSSVFITFAFDWQLRL